MPALAQNLTDNMDVALYKNSEWLNQGIFHHHFNKTGEDMTRYLNAYGAAISSATTVFGVPPKLAADLYLRTPKKKTPATQLLVPVACTLLFLITALFLYTFMTGRELQDLESQSDYLDRQLRRYQITQSDLERINRDISFMNSQIRVIDNFYNTWPDAYTSLTPLYKIHGSLRTELTNIAISNGKLSISGTTTDFIRLTDIIEELRDSPIYKSVWDNTARISTANPMLGNTENRTSFNLEIDLNTAGGIR
jgi:Tfp pilus assembly protein PilN